MTRRNAGSGGSIRQRPSGIWEGRYRQDGRQRAVYAPTAKEARAKLRKAIEAADAGIQPTPQRLTVAKYLDSWLDTSVRPRLRPRTVESYEDIVKRFLKPALGSQPLVKLTPADVGRMIADLTDAGKLSPTSVRYVHGVLRTALGRAVKQQLVVRNVAAIVDAPSRTQREMLALSAADTRAFLASLARHPHEALFVLALSTGARQGELLGLRWSDVDLDAGTITIRHSLVQGTQRLAATKTERSRRTLRLPATTLASLRGHKARQAATRLQAGPRWRDLDHVFTTRNGTPLGARNVVRWLHESLAAAGLPRVRFHDLRHSYATLMLEAGEELLVISRALGHVDLGTTANIYSHVTPAMRQRAAERMEGILTG